MRMLTGAILVLTAEQAYSHAHLIGFPHESTARQLLLPASLVFLVLGVILLVWGVFTEPPRSTRAASSERVDNQPPSASG